MLKGAPTMTIHHLASLAEPYILKDSAGLITKTLGAAAGSRKLYVNIDTVPPKAFSTKYHSHSQQEEFFLILSGSGTLRLNGKEFAVSQGDFFAKSAGDRIAHTFFNHTREPLMILDAGTNEPEDTCHYPDDGIYLHKSGEVRRAYRADAVLDGWEPSPKPGLEGHCDEGN